MDILLKRFGLVSYGLLSVVEGILNTILYITFMDKVIKPFDFSFPFYFNYTDKFLKSYYLKKQKRMIDG